MNNEKRTIYDVDEEQIEFINNFLMEQCVKVQPDLDISKIGSSKKLMAIELENKEYHYFFDKTPLLVVDLKLLIDGV